MFVKHSFRMSNGDRMRLRRVRTLAAAILLAAAGGQVAATPAQAHPIYSRAFTNVQVGKCMWAAPRDSPYGNYFAGCGVTPNLAAKWKLHVVRDNWNGSGHEEWVLESRALPGSCLRVDNVYYVLPASVMGTCDWDDNSNFNTFEAFRTETSGVYQLKSITWWEKGANICLNVLFGETGQAFPWAQSCNQGNYSRWEVGAAA
jgi:hypothetical protein